MAEGSDEVPRGGEIHRKLVAAMAALSGEHPGRRAAHAKGVWARGTFTPTTEGAALCRAPQLAAPCEALIRFSKAGGKPEAHDATRDGGGIAVKLRAGEGSEWDILATGSPAFVARTPEDFLELLEARRPDPETGEPDNEKLGEYLGRHPEAQLAISSALGAEPPASFTSVPYFSPHAFALTSPEEEETWVRWSWRPEGGEERLSDDDARALGRDYLRAALAERVPETMELHFQLRGEEDSLTDPTEPWPGERERVLAGRLEVSALIDDPEGDGHIEVFDPTRLPDGIEPSDDEILNARPRAYSVSAYKRLGE